MSKSDETQPKVSEKQEEPESITNQVSFTYVNNSEITGTNWEVRLAFAERLPSGKVEPRLGITMSHQHAKAFLETLTNTVGQLESIYGQIRYKEEHDPKQTIKAK